MPKQNLQTLQNDNSGMLIHVMIMSHFSLIIYRGKRYEFDRKLSLHELRMIMLSLANEELHEILN